MKWWLVLVLVWGSAYAKQPVYMTSLEWPPYSGETLADNGLSIAIAREAFAIMGYELIVEFKPWVRTVTTASKNDKYIGYLPEYYFKTNEFVFSNSIGSGPLGFVQNRQKPILWSSLIDLSRYRIGIVQGYVNTKLFDELVEQGTLEVEASVSDSRNIYKVAKGRLDLAVIDENVLRYLIESDPRKSVLAERLEMNRQLLEIKQLYLAFKNTPEGHSWRDIFNKGLEQVDVGKIASRLSKQGEVHSSD
tara:strand:- start:945 stop:1688 length:744 start_codon:yes stop_codon:yes gene_type:complete